MDAKVTIAELRVDGPVSVLEKEFWEAKPFVLEGRSSSLLNPGILGPYTVLFMPRPTGLLPIDIEGRLLGSCVLEMKGALPAPAPSTDKEVPVVRVGIPAFAVGDGLRLFEFRGPTAQELMPAARTTLDIEGSEETDGIIGCVDSVLETGHFEIGFEVDSPSAFEGENRLVGWSDGTGIDLDTTEVEIRCFGCSGGWDREEEDCVRDGSLEKLYPSIVCPYRNVSCKLIYNYCMFSVFLDTDLVQCGANTMTSSFLYLVLEALPLSRSASRPIRRRIHH